MPSWFSYNRRRTKTRHRRTGSLFRGETLRGLLLNAWGWWTIGSYALYAGFGLTVAAVAVFLARLFELWLAGRPGARVAQPRQAA